MINAYASLTTLKSDAYLQIPLVTSYDTELRSLLEHASRLLDKYCDRFFYCLETTVALPQYYAGASRDFFLPDDILSITTLKTDEDGDGTFENTLVENTDFFLYPLNTYPKIRAEINPNGSYGGFASGTKRGIEIVGVFGYGDGKSATPYYLSNDTVQDGAGMTLVQTTVTVADGTKFAEGQTIRIQLEQCYITSIAANVLTIIRAINGTVAATHALATVIYIYEYPMPIVQACLVTCMRAFKRSSSAFQDIVGSPETGQQLIYKGIDPDVKSIISQYRRIRL